VGYQAEFRHSNPASLLQASPWFTSPFIPAASRRVFWRRRIKEEKDELNDIFEVLPKKLNAYISSIKKAQKRN